VLKAARNLASSFTIERFTLPNGLRVVVSPDRSSPTVAVAVAYDVGFRSEPEGRTGFAHLFEHLMFQGSKNLAKGEFDRLIEGNGGVQNGSTHTDHTLYYEALPSNALEIALFGEADRMDEIALTEENLRNQVDVVKEEINVNVHNSPYGGFPWLHLPPLMFETFPNAHDGYGSFADLEAATVDDAASFYERYYAPGNAVLSIAGDVDPDEAHTLVERHFSRVPKRKVTKIPDCGEPIPDRERRGSYVDLNAPRPAIALGYRVPNPFTAFPEYLATVVLSSVLGDGHASRLYQKLVKEDRLATHVSSYVSTFSEWLGTRDPTLLEVIAYYTDVADTEALIASIDEACVRVSADLTVEELERVTSAFVSDYLSENDQLMDRTINLAVLEQQRGRAELMNEVPKLIAAVTTDEVAEAAATWLDPNKRAVLEWRPGR
jgi:predicted Zn-dependent peptidase